MDLTTYDKRTAEARQVLDQLPDEVNVTHVLASAQGQSIIGVYLPPTNAAHKVVASLCGLFGTPAVAQDVLVFAALPTVRIQASGGVRRFVKIPQSAQFVMPEDAA